MVDDVQDRTAKLLAEHSRTSGMAVSMGWTCRCGHWCENINDATGHQAAMLRAAGLLASPSPRTRTRRSGTRACKAVDEALGTAGYDPAWIGSVGPESVWSDGPCPPTGTTWCVHPTVGAVMVLPAVWVVVCPDPLRAVLVRSGHE